MVHRKIISVFAGVLIVGVSSFTPAEAGIPDMWESTASIDYQGPGPVVMFNVPNGSGSAFTDARDPFGLVDATITLTLRDSSGDPVANFPAEDVWLEIDSVCPCALWTMMANVNSDAAGMMYWVNPLFAGGWSLGPTVVVVSGNPLMSGDLDISHNSPDIDCDLTVNLTDVAHFAGDFYGEYSFRSDFHYDGVLNLVDIARFALALGASCP